MAAESAEALFTSRDIIIGFVSAAIAGLGFYIKFYLRKDAEIAAMSKNIEQLIAQQQSLTKATEEVKQDIEHQAWRKKEFELVKRQKLEEFALLLGKLDVNLRIKFSRDVELKGKELVDDNIIGKVLIIQSFYIPELENETLEIVEIYINCESLITKIVDNKSNRPPPAFTLNSAKHDVDYRVSKFSCELDVINNKVGAMIHNLSKLAKEMTPL